VCSNAPSGVQHWQETTSCEQSATNTVHQWSPEMNSVVYTSRNLLTPLQN